MKQGEAAERRSPRSTGVPPRLARIPYGVLRPVDFWKSVYGPTIVAYRNVSDDPERVEALDRDLAALAARYDSGTGTTVLDWEYLRLTARRA